MTRKKILFLGGSKFQIPPLVYSKRKGYEVITCDYLPENPGHKYADKYYNVSTTDHEAVLKVASKEKVDGIVAYASDPAAATQAYVANKLGLPSNPYESVKILSRKDLFRDFLNKNGFLTPKSMSFYLSAEALEWANETGYPLIVKPVDSSGSKGVKKIYGNDELSDAFKYALQYSREGKVTVEEYFLRDGYQIAGDGFVVNGKLAFRCWANEHFDKQCNPFVPIGESFPSAMTDKTLNQAHSETERLLELLDIRTGALNFDFHYNRDGDFSFLELGPRNGGNLIPEVIKYSTGVDLVKYTVEAAIGGDCAGLEMKESNGYYSSYMVHAVNDGIMDSIWYSNEIRKNIIEETMYCNIGESVKKFNGSNETLGTMILGFESELEMLDKMDNMEKYFKVMIK
ncbi:MAG TPA: ATP-grasp domain-containing protein [Gammaproteobacteria bacterium]|nr:ATP-grasp domain-containing protein [Gammaproteobacteria bacterium]